ncbi:MAG TPA: ribonuclease HII [Nitrospirae bacterium]|nr:ribonuclease HII [Nitrospirota bacterium]
MYEFDDQYRKQGYDAIAGIDEAGRGPLAGPVVAAAAILPKGLSFKGLNDSKKVSEKNRKRLFFEILASGASVGVGVSAVEEICAHNILGATLLAMVSAINDLALAPDFLVLDAVKLKEVDIPQDSVIKGDTKSASVAAASIVAKYVRDSIMRQYHILYPEYGFDRHKGYGTRLHMDAIREHGPCPIHRKGFIKNICSTEEHMLF